MLPARSSKVPLAQLRSSARIQFVPSLCPTLFHRLRQPLSSLVGDAAACLCISGGQLRTRGSPRPGERSVPRSIRLRVRFLQGCYSSIEPLPFISQIFDDFLDVQLSSFASSDPPYFSGLAPQRTSLRLEQASPRTTVNLSAASEGD